MTDHPAAPPIDLAAVALDQLLDAARAFREAAPHDEARLRRRHDEARRDLFALCVWVTDMKGANDLARAKCKKHSITP